MSELERWIAQDYYTDGQMKLSTRERMLRHGLSREEIDQIEQIWIGHGEIKSSYLIPDDGQLALPKPMQIQGLDLEEALSQGLIEADEIEYQTPIKYEPKFYSEAEIASWEEF